MRRLQLVVPSAGGGRGRRLTAPVTAALRADRHDVVLTPTRSLEHADELVAAAVADDRVVVAMGGDGLVGRVAGALDGGLMAVLPAGRGNDLCRTLGVPRRAVAACAVLRTGRERALDLGVVTSAVGEVPFLGIASIGFDSDEQERVLRSRVPLGRLVYVVGALRTLAHWTPAEFRCTVDGEPLTVSGWSVAVADSGRYSGGMLLAPDASLTDARLDVVTIAALGRLRLLGALPGVFRGTHVRRPEVRVRQGRLVELDADRPFRVFADGDSRAPCPPPSPSARPPCACSSPEACRAVGGRAAPLPACGGGDRPARTVRPEPSIARSGRGSGPADRRRGRPAPRPPRPRAPQDAPPRWRRR